MSGSFFFGINYFLQGVKVAAPAAGGAPKASHVAKALYATEVFPAGADEPEYTLFTVVVPSAARVVPEQAELGAFVT